MKLPLSIILIILFNLLYGQKYKEEKKVLIIKEFLKKSDEFSKTNLDSAFYYAKKVDELIENLPENIDKFEIYKYLGDIYLEKGSYVKSWDYFLKATTINNKLKDNLDKKETYISNSIGLQLQFGNIFLLQKNYDGALKYYKKANITLENSKLNNTQIVSELKLRILNNTAATFLGKGDYKKALSYFELIRKSNLNIKNQAFEATLLNNIGICYQEEKKYSKAISYF